MSAAKYIQFDDGPDHVELRDLIGKEATFGGDIAEALSGEVLKYGVNVRIRIRDSFLVCAPDGSQVRQVEAEGTGDSCFRKGEHFSFVYDATARQSEEIPLT